MGPRLRVVRASGAKRGCERTRVRYAGGFLQALWRKRRKLLVEHGIVFPDHTYCSHDQARLSQWQHALQHGVRDKVFVLRVRVVDRSLATHHHSLRTSTPAVCKPLRVATSETSRPSRVHKGQMVYETRGAPPS